jgi:3D-(3,5/4)-trihydroxycyclohexane-1,2-dione acylhydrolase (decyclizing)
MASMPISRRFVNIYVADFGAAKHAGSRLVGDARAALEAPSGALSGYEVEAGYREHNARANEERDQEVERPYTPGHAPLLSQGQVIGAINTFSEPEDVVVCAAGSMPGDLHKPWRVHDPKGYHVEYGYTCMGYEIAGGLGMKWRRRSARTTSWSGTAPT